MLIVGTKEPMKELLTSVPSSLIRTLEQTLAVQAPFINCYLLALTSTDVLKPSKEGMTVRSVSLFSLVSLVSQVNQSGQSVVSP